VAVTNNIDTIVSLDNEAILSDSVSAATINSQFKQQLRFLQFILNDINYGIIVLDQNLHICLVNTVAKSISHFENEFIAKYPHVTEGFVYTRLKGGYGDISDNDWNAFIQHRLDELKQSEVQTRDIELIDKRVYRYSSIPLIDGGRLLTYSDITENKIIEKELQSECNLLRTIMDSIPEKVYYKDRDSKFVFANKYYFDYFGFSSSDELIGKTDFDIHPQKNAQIFFDTEQELMANRTTLIDHEDGGGAYGEGNWFLVNKAPVFDSDGKVIGLAGISQDITRRKQSEIALSQQNTYLNALHKTSLAIMERLELSELTKTIVEQTSLLTNSDSFLYLPTEDGKHLYCLGK